MHKCATIWLRINTTKGVTIMDTIPVRVKKTIHKDLKNLAEQLHKPMQMVLEEALEAYRRQQFFDELDTKAAALKQDKSAWQEELEERIAWDTTLADGLPKESWEDINIHKKRKKRE